MEGTLPLSPSLQEKYRIPAKNLTGRRGKCLWNLPLFRLSRIGLPWWSSVRKSLYLHQGILWGLKGQEIASPIKFCGSRQRATTAVDQVKELPPLLPQLLLPLLVPPLPPLLPLLPPMLLLLSLLSVIPILPTPAFVRGVGLYGKKDNQLLCWERKLLFCDGVTNLSAYHFLSGQQWQIIMAKRSSSIDFLFVLSFCKEPCCLVTV